MQWHAVACTLAQRDQETRDDRLEDVDVGCLARDQLGARGSLLGRHHVHGQRALRGFPRQSGYLSTYAQYMKVYATRGRIGHSYR